MVLAREQPDVVLMDVMMPVLGGREACRLMRQRPELRHVAVVVMSAGDPPPQDGAESGFLPKPFRRADLLDIVASATAG